jgi:hypothetical protein
VFSAVLETSADPALIVTSCDSHVILQSLIRRHIPDFCRWTVNSFQLQSSESSNSLFLLREHFHMIVSIGSYWFRE